MKNRRCTASQLSVNSAFSPTSPSTRPLVGESYRDTSCLVQKECSGAGRGSRREKQMLGFNICSDPTDLISYHVASKNTGVLKNFSLLFDVYILPKLQTFAIRTTKNRTSLFPFLLWFVGRDDVWVKSVSGGHWRSRCKPVSDVRSHTNPI